MSRWRLKIPDDAAAIRAYVLAKLRALTRQFTRHFALSDNSGGIGVEFSELHSVSVLPSTPATVLIKLYYTMTNEQNLGLRARRRKQIFRFGWDGETLDLKGNAGSSLVSAARNA